MNRRLNQIIFILFTFFLASQAWAFLDEDEPLMPKEAFKLKAYAIEPNLIRVEWNAADGYYLYKEKFKFSTDSKGITLGEPKYPKGKIKEDEFFGKVESFRNNILIDIPIERAQDASQELNLKTVSQGCADIGVCYPPQTENVVFALIPEDDTSMFAQKKAPGSGILSGINASDSSGFLPAEKAFAFGSEVVDGNLIVLEWDIADGYYLYRDKFEFSIDEADGITLGKPKYPKSKIIEDDVFGEMAVFYQHVAVKIPLGRSKAEPTSLSLRIKYQGCADAGFCYPPMTTTTSLMLPEGDVGARQVTKQVVSANNDADMFVNRVVSEQDGIANSLANDNFFIVVLSFFGFGLLLAFTPCVFPMIPILSSIIVGQGEQVTTRQAFKLSVVYVLAMALTYTVTGVIAGLFGANLQAVFQNPWILGTFSFVFVLLSFSMFGFYELQLPASLQSKLTEMSNKQEGGTVAGVAIMGFLSALIVGPCVAAPLMGALIYIGQTGDAVLGGVALFALSMGMGAPLIAIGSSAGKLLPKAGPWMDAIKAVFGVLLLAVAIWMLERIIPAPVAMLLWALLLIVSGVFMGALLQTESTVSGWRKFWKAMGVVLVIYGGLLLIGVASNSSDPLQPLRGLNFGGDGGGASAHAEVEFKKIKSVDDLRREIKVASAQGKPLMLDFYADWCVSCKEMERYTFADARVMKAMSKAVLLQADVTANDEQDKALLKEFRLIGPPSMIFWDRNGTELQNMRLVGFMETEDFLAHLDVAFK
ncbi:MAG TPA: protein-disulfide reductase DsbD [Gammaproteobacteria bacterium]|nr:protein-disulfide reductase DsbD [Gammaproteobacteria bacterium]